MRANIQAVSLKIQVRVHFLIILCEKDDRMVLEHLR